MGNGLPLGQLSHLGTRIGLRRVSQHPGSGQNFVCPENLVELNSLPPFADWTVYTAEAIGDACATVTDMPICYFLAKRC